MDFAGAAGWLSRCSVHLTQRLPRLLVIRTATQRRAKFVGRPGGVAQFFEAMPEIEMCIGVIGLERNGPPKTVGRLTGLLSRRLHAAQTKLAIDRLGIEPYRLGERFLGSIRASELAPTIWVPISGRIRIRIISCVNFICSRFLPFGPSSFRLHN